MVTQELAIKNMVCIRCIRAVEQELQQQGYQVRHVELGLARVEGAVIDLNAIADGLALHGLELLTGRNACLINQVKILIRTLVQSGEAATLRTTLSAYLAHKIGMDYPYLSHVFSTTEQLTIEKFWILQRVERAKELLSYNELSISTIAQMLGYSSTAYLTNQFKQITGLTPAAYRSQRCSTRNPLDWI